MKVKVSELQGDALDWAVMKCDGICKDFPAYWVDEYPSTDWSQGGPIIEREMITVGPAKHEGFMAWAWPKKDGFWGDSPLIAAMRCYVASKLGDEIELPEELK